MASTSFSSAPPHQDREFGEAFDEIAPPYASSSSSSSSSKPCKWDVFINHCGNDVKYTLATTIRNTLTPTGLRVFLDVDALQAGDVIPASIQHAMANASLHIAIFSVNYAHSPWCLAELSFMLKTCTRIIPLFYHVDPSDLRWVRQEKGIYAPAFSEHQNKGRYSSEKLEEWKIALENVSFHSGCVVKNNNDEKRVLKNIVNMVFKAMGKMPFQVAKHPVGLDDVVGDFERSTLRSAESVQIVGIVGMGGLGKTTLAKELYNQKISSFHNSSFIFQVRDAASRNALHKKQKKLLKDLGAQDKDLTFDNTEEGRGILQSRLSSLCALIVLDDVDHKDQLDALLPQRDRLGSGSLVIVTSRELGVLTQWRIFSIYNMRPLNQFHAEQLFCWHAFLQSHPFRGFEYLVEKFLNACSGLPLSLEVFGGHVYGKSKEYWECELHKISRILPKDIKERLQVSFDALDPDEQEVFMDVACFFIGERISLAIAVWDGSDWSGLHSWETLMNKCLVDLDQYNCITMHDHLRDLGRDLANAHSPSRLWHEEHIINSQRQARERMLIRGIKFEFNGALSPFEKFMEYMGISNRWFRRPLPSSLGLKLLIDRRREFTKDFATPGEELVWLRGLQFQNRSLPSWLSLRKLRVLELKHANNLKKLWANADPPLQLRQLTITSGFKFQSFPTSIGRLRHLKTIMVTDTHMKRLPQQFCDLQLLEHLDLRASRQLSSLPASFGDLTNLRHIDFSGCWNLEMLPVSFKQLIHLQHLDLSQCYNLTFRRLDMMEDMAKLEYLNFNGCRKLQELPHQITNQAFLRELYLDPTSLTEVPTNIDQLGKLEVLEIASPFLKSLPSFLENLSSLTRLKIDGCEKLELLPNSVDIGGSPLTKLGSSLCKLRELVIYNTKVLRISVSEACGTSLETLILRGNHHLIDVETLPTSLKIIKVRKCKMLKKIRAKNTLVNLQILKIYSCPELNELPSFEHSASLKEIIMEECGKLDKFEGLENSKSLEKFKAITHWTSPGVQSVEGTERLKSLYLVAENGSSLQPCIQTIKKWPWEMVIGGRTVSGAESVMDSFSFPNLTVVRSLQKNIGMAKCAKAHISDAAILCFVINSYKEPVYCKLSGPHETDVTLLNVKLQMGKWVFVGLLRQGCRLMEKPTVAVEARLRYGKGEVERGMLVVGEEGRLLEAFTHFWNLFM